MSRPLDDKFDALCIRLFGKEMNGERLIADDSGWCGRIQSDMADLKRQVAQLNKRTRWIDRGIGAAAALSAVFGAVVGFLSHK